MNSSTKLSDIAVATCTDLRQKWGKLKNDVRTLYAVVPVKKFCHGSEPTSVYKIPRVSESMQDDVLRMLSEGMAGGVLFL